MRQGVLWTGALLAAAAFGPASPAAAKGGCTVRPSTPVRIAAPAGEGFANQGWIRRAGRYRCGRAGRRTITMDPMFVTTTGRVIRGLGGFGKTGTFTRPMPRFKTFARGESPCVATLQRAARGTGVQFTAAFTRMEVLAGDGGRRLDRVDSPQVSVADLCPEYAAAPAGR